MRILWITLAKQQPSEDAPRFGYLMPLLPRFRDTRPLMRTLMVVPSQNPFVNIYEQPKQCATMLIRGSSVEVPIWFLGWLGDGFNRICAEFGAMTVKGVHGTQPDGTLSPVPAAFSLGTCGSPASLSSFLGVQYSGARYLRGTG